MEENKLNHHLRPLLALSLTRAGSGITVTGSDQNPGEGSSTWFHPPRPSTWEAARWCCDHREAGWWEEQYCNLIGFMRKGLFPLSLWLENCGGNTGN